MKKGMIYTAATAGYCYALRPQARRVAANLRTAGISPSSVGIVIVTDDSGEAMPAVDLYRTLLPGVDIELVELSALAVGSENYQRDAQLMIAQLRTAATDRVLAEDPDWCWSLDSDVLPPANALRCMLQMLEFDGGFYGVAFCPYPSQGGGGFLSGHGSPTDPIFADFSEEEKEVPAELTDRRDEIRKLLEAAETDEGRKKLVDQLHQVEKEIRELPPRGNVFEMNAKAWRRRGWFDHAYPAIGKGAVVPVDWIGFGCTLMGREALALCDWTGYDGGGTEDLFINYRRWHPAGIRIASIPHCPCDHALRSRETPGKVVLMMTGHEGGGECVGHLRRQGRPWYAHDAGERFSEANDGRL